MRAIVFDETGPPDQVLQVRECAKPVPARGQVLVRMIASPVNPSDIMYVRGRYGLKPHFPATPGFEGVGVVEQSGGGVLGWFRKGRRVAVLNDGGNWAEYALAPARRVIPVPDDIPDSQAASFFVNPATAWVLTRKVLAVPSGSWLLQSAAASALGKMVIRLGQRYGFRTLNLVRRPEQVEELKSLGADAVLNISDPDWVKRVPEIVGSEGLRYAIDPVGGELATAMLETLSPGGRLVIYGALSEQPCSAHPRAMITGNLRIEGFWLANYMKQLSILKSLRLIRQVRVLIREGVLKTDIAAEYSLDQIQEAVRHAIAPGKTGKVLLKIGSGSNL